MIRILTIVLVGLCSCTSSNNKLDTIGNTNAEPTYDSDFMEFVSLLPQIELPFNTDCGKCCEHPEIDRDNQLIKKFIPEGSTVFGLIGRTSDKILILVTYPADTVLPVVVAYNFDGKITDKKEFMTSYCGGDFEYYGINYFSINKDLSFTSIDTSYILKMDTIDYHIIDTTRIDVVRKEFILNRNGEIIESNTR